MWTRTSDILPANGKIMETKIHDKNGARNVQRLKRSGAMWFTPDGGMYVYYHPTHWRKVAP